MTEETGETGTAEDLRLREDARREKNWKRWGPYLAERQWGTVREDYSPDGKSWSYFPHDHARSRAYRWGEDGLLGITDRQARLCFALALWNGRDPILKERLFGLTGPQGNHGEDVKECYFYLDSTPTHSYMKAMYRYPHAEFPYARLVEENQRRSKTEREFELSDAGVFAENRFFDVVAEYAKASPDDIVIRLTIHNRGPEPAAIHVLPTLWYRNTWAAKRSGEGHWPKPSIVMNGASSLLAEHASLGRFLLAVGANPGGDSPAFLFTDNETHTARLFLTPETTRHVKDAFHEYVVHGRAEAVNPAATGTKTAAHFRCELAGGAAVTLPLRLHAEAEASEEPLGPAHGTILEERRREADEFFSRRLPADLDEAARDVMRRGYAGLLWTKQFYYYSVQEWFEGDPGHPAPPERRLSGRNRNWTHLYNRDVISMPDKWEYPWYAAWDLAFHMIPFAGIDEQFAKQQLILLLREWYMHPNGQIPAYEFNLSDVNPPVHAWAAWRVYKAGAARGRPDRVFLSRVFHKLLLNFTWWINRKDTDGNHVFAGGFLGLDNIGVFDRSRPLPTGGHMEQADGTAWMGFFCITMLSMALELAGEDPSYEDVASKFFEHFVAIADAMNTLDGAGLWEEDDGFYYDHLHLDGEYIPLRVRSMVGLLPLMTVGILQDDVVDRLPGFKKRMQWFLDNRSDLARHISYCDQLAGEPSGLHLLAIPSRDRLVRILRYMLDENEFLSGFGIRSLSKVHAAEPYVFHVGAEEYRVEYLPGESDSYLFGGNSNWRGPVWFPLNYLIIEALERYHRFYGSHLQVECPAGSAKQLTLKQVAREIAARLTRLFLPGENGRRPCHGDEACYADDPLWRDLVLFYEYFDGDTGRGLGASHQTGWTALVVNCFEKLAGEL